jgi:hypothetical protein
MNNPTLQFGATTITLPMPSDWSVKPIVGENQQTSIGGADFVDVAYRKYEFELIWDAIWSTDYDTLEDLINDAIDAGDTVWFDFDKFPQSSDGVDVIARLSARDRTGGSGQSYYSKVVLTLREVEAR